MGWALLSRHVNLVDIVRHLKKWANANILGQILKGLREKILPNGQYNGVYFFIFFSILVPLKINLLQFNLNLILKIIF